MRALQFAFRRLRICRLLLHEPVASKHQALGRRRRWRWGEVGERITARSPRPAKQARAEQAKQATISNPITSLSGLVAHVTSSLFPVPWSTLRGTTASVAGVPAGSSRIVPAVAAVPGRF